MSKLLVSGEHNVYIGRIPAEVELPIAFGELMAGLRLSDRGGLVIGVQSPAGQQRMNAAKDYLVEPGSELIYMAERPLLEATA